MNPSVELRDLTVSYGSTEVLRRLSLNTQEGELLALLGPSGCGKTTVLKTIAGLIQPSSGAVLFDGEAVTHAPAEKRRIALVLQKPLLFPHMTVGENVGFGLKMRGTPPNEITRRVNEALELVKLPGMHKRRPTELSGGQEQRVALARALVTEPKVLLLDEPFSALDQGLREEMRTFVRALQRRSKIATIFVTHDQQEATLIADRIALMLNGRIAQVGPPTDFYETPTTVDVARFFGWQTLQGPPVVAFRADCCRIGIADADVYSVTATVQDAIRTGSIVRYFLRTESGETFRVEHPAKGHLPSHVGDAVTATIPRECIRIFS